MVGDEFYSSAAVARVTVEELWAESRHPIDGCMMVMFQHEVHWLRETSFEVLFMHGGQVVQDLGTFSSSTISVENTSRAAIDVARRRAAYFGVRPTSTAEIVVIERSCETPVLLPRAEPARTRSMQVATEPHGPVLWRRFPMAEWRRREASPHGSGYLYPQISRGVMTERQVWTSHCMGQFFGHPEAGAEGVPKQEAVFDSLVREAAVADALDAPLALQRLG